jgi:hypothetical protein
MHAVFIPVSHEAIVRYGIESAAAAAVTVGVLGLGFTLKLYLSKSAPRDEGRRPTRPA